MAFGTFQVLAGDFHKGKNSQYAAGTFLMEVQGKFTRESIPVHNVQSIELASEESVKRLGGTVGWGIAGAALLGPVGLLAGLLAGGRGKDTTFIVIFKDGRKFMATGPSKVYTQIQAALF